MSKTFVNPTIKLKETVKTLRQELKYWKRKYAGLEDIVKRDRETARMEVSRLLFKNRE